MAWHMVPEIIPTQMFPKPTSFLFHDTVFQRSHDLEIIVRCILLYHLHLQKHSLTVTVISSILFTFLVLGRKPILLSHKLINLLRKILINMILLIFKSYKNNAMNTFLPSIQLKTWNINRRSSYSFPQSYYECAHTLESITLLNLGFQYSSS